MQHITIPIQPPIRDTPTNATNTLRTPITRQKIIFRHSNKANPTATDMLHTDSIKLIAMIVPHTNKPIVEHTTETQPITRQSTPPVISARQPSIAPRLTPSTIIGQNSTAPTIIPTTRPHSESKHEKNNTTMVEQTQQTKITKFTTATRVHNPQIEREINTELKEHNKPIETNMQRIMLHITAPIINPIHERQTNNAVPIITPMIGRHIVPMIDWTPTPIPIRQPTTIQQIIAMVEQIAVITAITPHRSEATISTVIIMDKHIEMTQQNNAMKVHTASIIPSIVSNPPIRKVRIHGTANTNMAEILQIMVAIDDNATANITPQMQVRHTANTRDRIETDEIVVKQRIHNEIKTATIQPTKHKIKSGMLTKIEHTKAITHPITHSIKIGTAMQQDAMKHTIISNKNDVTLPIKAEMQ